MNDIEVIRRRFAEWLSLPKTHRVPRTQADFANEHNISREQLSRWKKDPEFKVEVADAGLDWFSSDDISDIVLALKLSAKKGNVPAIKLCLQMSGIIGELGEEAPKTSGQMASMSTEELEAYANMGAG